MLKSLKIKLFSENGMKIVNTLFFITVFWGGSVMTILSYSIWLIFLACSVRCTESKAMRAFYLLVAVCVAVVVVWQAAWLFTGVLRGF